MRSFQGLFSQRSIILTEFIKIVEREDAARMRLRLLSERERRLWPWNKRRRSSRGDLLRHKDVPIANALIVSFVRTGAAECVVTDDPTTRPRGVRKVA
jgi:hypothetical protein